jgi:sulfoacetaldehyde dehydrogenase
MDGDQQMSDRTTSQENSQTTERPKSNTPPRDERAAEVVVADAIDTAAAAMDRIADYDQAAADDLARAVTLAVYRESRARQIAERTVADTEMGAVADKKRKLRGRLLAVLEDTLGTPTVGEVPSDRPGVTAYARPVGVVGALVPSTNPAPTVANVALLALRGRNAVVFSAAPSSLGVVQLTVTAIREELTRLGAPADLVQVLPAPANKARAHALLDQADLVQVTGSSANVAAGERCGTPNYCVGEGNLVAIVDETVTPDRVADDIVAGLTFDHSITCVGESNLVVHEAVADSLVAALESRGGDRCSTAERDRLEAVLFPDGSLNRSLVGAPAADLVAAADIDIEAPGDADRERTGETEGTASDGPEFLLVEAAGVGPDHPLTGEKLTNVLTVHRVGSFPAALTRTTRLLEYEGAGHSCVVHTSETTRAERAGHELPVCRIAVNQTALGPAGTATNGLHTTYSLGGGPWAGNQLEENLSVEQFITTTRVAYPLKREEPDPASLLGPVAEGPITPHAAADTAEAAPDEPGDKSVLARLLGLGG